MSYLELNFETGGGTKVIMYKMRFVIIAVYFFMTFTLGMYQNSFAPIQNVVKKTYSKTSTQVNMLAIVSHGRACVSVSVSVSGKF